MKTGSSLPPTHWSRVRVTSLTPLPHSLVPCESDEPHDPSTTHWSRVRVSSLTRASSAEISVIFILSSILSASAPAAIKGPPLPIPLLPLRPNGDRKSDISPPSEDLAGGAGCWWCWWKGLL